MPFSRIIDSHIHLWPGTATQPEHHGWMTPGHQLAKQHGIEDYSSIVEPRPEGFIYVETDRYLPSFEPGIEEDDDLREQLKKLTTWAQEPIREMMFLRRIVEGEPVSGDGFSPADGELLKGCVIWAPFHLPHAYFQIYLSISEEIAGPALWNRVVGFRYLLQGKAEGEVKRLVESEAWLENMLFLRTGREGKGWSFDVGIDIHRDGEQRLEEVTTMIQQVRKREAAESEGQNSIRFILNHLNKPALSESPSAETITRYRTALSTLSADRNVYMKLSGSFNEMMNNQPTPNEVSPMVKMLQPWTNIVFASFPRRVLFGSDWPVCNVGGPKGEKGNWKFWTEVVQEVMRGVGEEESEWVWWKTAAEAYALDL